MSKSFRSKIYGVKTLGCWKNFCQTVSHVFILIANRSWCRWGKTRVKKVVSRAFLHLIKSHSASAISIAHRQRRGSNPEAGANHPRCIRFLPLGSFPAFSHTASAIYLQRGRLWWILKGARRQKYLSPVNREGTPFIDLFHFNTLQNKMRKKVFVLLGVCDAFHVLDFTCSCEKGKYFHLMCLLSLNIWADWQASNCAR